MTYEYSRWRPISAIAFIVCLIALIILVSVAWSYYRQVPQKVIVQIGSIGDFILIQKCMVTVTRGSDGSDVMEVSVYFLRSEKAIKRTQLLITVPEELKIKSGGYFGKFRQVESWSTKDNEKDIRFESSNYIYSPTLTAKFSGNIFGETSSLDFQMRLSVYHNGAALDVPTEVRFIGMAGVALDQILPEPNERHDHFLQFLFPSTNDAKFANGVTLLGFDRARLASTQFRTFLVATLIGVLLSTVISAILGFIRDFETSSIFADSGLAKTQNNSKVRLSVNTDSSLKLPNKANSADAKKPRG